MNRAPVLSLVFILGLSLTAYPQAPAPQTPAAAPEEPLPVLSVPRDYRYNARGRRDPFVNPVPKPVVAGPVIPTTRPPGLKGVLVAEAGISGVVTSKEPTMNVVIISAPGGKTYFARVGDSLFDAVIKEIRLDTITFALTAPGGGIEVANPREIVRKVRPTPGEK